MLLSWWFLALLTGGALAGPVAGVVLGVRRRRRRRVGRPVISGWRLGMRRLSLVAVTLTCGLGATAAAVNDHYSYIPSFHALFGDVSPDLVSHPVAARSALPAGRGEEALVAKPAKATKTEKPDHGTVEKVKVDGPTAGIGARDTYVYLPPDYFDPARPAQRFPVLYLLHGSPGVSVDWIRGGWLDRAMDDLLARHEIAPFIVVMPDVNGGYRRDTECEDIPGGPLTQTYLVTDVVGFVDANYRTIPERGARVMGGLSTGGYCALNLVLRHQDTFSGIVSHSGSDRPDHNVYTGDLFGSDREAERANTPGLYLPTIPLAQPLGVYLDVGAADGSSRAESVELSHIFERRGVPVTFHDFADESHNWLVWRRNLFSSLPWVSGWFGTTGAAVPPGTGGGSTAAAGGAAAGTTVAAPPRNGPEQAPTDAELQAAPDDQHAEGPAAAPKGEAAPAGRHLTAGPPHGAHRPRGRAAATAGPGATRAAATGGPGATRAIGGDGAAPGATARLRPHRAGEHRAAS